MDIVNIRKSPGMKDRAITYFQDKWANEDSMKVYEDCISRSIIAKNSLPIWYLLMDEEKIIGCAGLITNDFISYGDLWPWLCALYIEKDYRGSALSGLLINQIKEDTIEIGFKTVYLCTDLVGFYEKYGFTYLGIGYHPWGENSRVYECKLER